MNSSATDSLGSKMKEVVSRVESEYKVEVLAVTSNASELSRRGRQMLFATRPDILSVDCAVDCISGLMAEYFKVGPRGGKRNLGHRISGLSNTFDVLSFLEDFLL